MLEFLKQWRSLEHRRKNLDFEMSRWCAAVRAEFASGAAGDKAFGHWLATEIGIPVERQEECRMRADAFAIIPDHQEWDALGGFVQIRKLIPLDKRERVAVIGAAKASGYRIATVVRQRESRQVMPHQTPAVVLFAEFIESLEADIVPEELRELARSYIRARALNVDKSRSASAPS